MRQIKSSLENDVFLFDSMVEVFDYINPKLSDTYLQAGSGFIGEKFESWADVQNKAKSAWDYGMSVLQSFVERLQKIDMPELKSRKRRVRFNTDGGDEVDIERLLTGQPYWRESRREESSGPTEVTIVMDATATAGVAADNILWRGAAGVALAQILEQRGYLVELWIVDAGKLFADSQNQVIIACNLKRPQDPLDVSTLVNVASGWFYRTVTFTLMASICEKTGHPLSPGLGRVYMPKPADLDAITPDELRIFSAGVFTFSGAVQVIEREMQRFAKNLTD